MLLAKFHDFDLTLINTLLLLAANLPPNHAAIVTNSTIPEVTANVSTITNDCINNFKLEHLNQALKQIDGAVQNLEDKAHNWAIFRHHIDAWNEQIKSLEHKLNLVKRTQDEQQVFGSKLISLEFTLNHILSKVVYLSDTCNNQLANAIVSSPRRSSSSSSNFDSHTKHNGNDNGRDPTQQQQQRDTDELLYEHIALLADLKQSFGVDKQLRSEFTTRLNNILRHVQNIERDSCRGDQRRQHTTSNSNNKMAKLMAPIGSNCNSNQNIERAIKSLDHQVSTLSTRASIPKDLKQTPSLVKKNSQQLDNILNWMKKVDQRLVQWRDESDHDWNQCQTISGELSTFTESSDLLLKRIEMLMNDVNEKLAKQPLLKPSLQHDNAEESEVHEEDVNDVEKTPHQADNETDIDTGNNAGNANNDPPSAADADEETSKIDDRFDIVDFLQPDKQSCHELDGPAVDGVYKFSTPEMNEANRNFNERYCAYATEGAPWTVVQNRGPYAEHENFNRSWADYKNGFGELNKEFWFGNEFMHQMVDREDYELRIELTDFDNEQMWAEYSFFRLDSEQYNYNLLIGGYNGTAPDAMHYHNEMDFSTFDRRNDRSVDACCACATGYGNGWWFDNCSEANLNGIYRETPNGHNYVGIIWEPWHGDYSLLKARMLIRPKNWLNKREMFNVRHNHSDDP